MSECVCVCVCVLCVCGVCVCVSAFGPAQISEADFIHRSERRSDIPLYFWRL